MLQTKITYKDYKEINDLLLEEGFIRKDNYFLLPLPSHPKIQLKVEHHATEQYLQLLFPDNVTMDDCEAVNKVIQNLSKYLDGDIDDSKGQLGYDENGDKVFIYHGFDQWKDYIENAKHHSLEGQHVNVFHGDELLGRGILLTYNQERTHKQTTTCTLLTTTGEQYFVGDNLKIIGVM
ncbi:hypothetical protein QA612_17005 [Evansella sp. AB-P1]|uniref:hypothetical protein n=1 Tax=Evansella sp. AB-P1 TaxID=3037653 RepID=UPI00241CC526|nr:hypothetical protein [Evansella sp. AB-P1]MDG5789159.1 hypothetical protein [Evansella sp. AB-P1]